MPEVTVTVRTVDEMRCRYCPWVGPDVLLNVCVECREEFYGDEGDDYREDD